MNVVLKVQCKEQESTEIKKKEKKRLNIRVASSSRLENWRLLYLWAVGLVGFGDSCLSCGLCGRVSLYLSDV